MHFPGRLRLAFCSPRIDRLRRGFHPRLPSRLDYAPFPHAFPLALITNFFAALGNSRSRRCPFRNAGDFFCRLLYNPRPHHSFFFDSVLRGPRGHIRVRFRRPCTIKFARENKYTRSLRGSKNVVTVRSLLTPFAPFSFRVYLSRYDFRVDERRLLPVFSDAGKPARVL